MNKIPPSAVANSLAENMEGFTRDGKPLTGHEALAPQILAAAQNCKPGPSRGAGK